MAGNIADYGESLALDYLLGGSKAVYLALYTAAPSDAGGGTEVTTAGGTLYARLALAGKMSAAGEGAKKNNTDLVFPVAGANWGEVTHFAVLDASSGAANYHWWGALEAAKKIETSDQYFIETNKLVFSLD
jgi:hypothetical protein